VLPASQKLSVNAALFAKAAMADNSRHVDLLDRAAGTGGRFYAVNSPRSLEACLRTGYDPAELLPRHPSTYATPDMSRSMVHAMGKHFETRRREKVAAVSAERQNIIGYLDGMKDPEEAATGSMLPAVTGAGKTGGSQTGRSMNASLGAPVVVAETIEDRVAKMQSQMMANEMDRLQAAQKRCVASTLPVLLPLLLRLPLPLPLRRPRVLVLLCSCATAATAMPASLLLLSLLYYSYSFSS